MRHGKLVGQQIFLKYFATKSNPHKSGLRMVREIEHFGGSIDVNIGREYISYGIPIINYDSSIDNITVAFESLKYMLTPNLLEYEVDEVRQEVARQDICPGRKLLELSHYTGFRDQGLGQPLFASPHQIQALDARHLHRHLTDNYIAPNITVVGYGIKENIFQDNINQHFAKIGLEGKYSEIQKLPPLEVQPTVQTTNWSGGEVLNRHSGPANIQFSYQSASRSSKDASVFSIIRTYIRDQCLPNTNNLECYNHSYEDTGIITIAFQAPPRNAKTATEEVFGVVGGLSKISRSNFNAAKSLTVSEHLHAISQTKALIQQLIEHRRPNNVEQINSVTLEDFIRVGNQMANGSPVVVAAGDVRGIPKF